MYDPIPSYDWLQQAATPIANRLNLRTLPLHVHEIILSFVFFNTVNSIISPFVCSRLLPTIYTRFSRRDRLNWDIHVTSLVHSVIITSAVVWVILTDNERRANDWAGRIWGYTGAQGMVEGITTGYFLWDMKVCTTNFGMLGIFDLIHAFSASIAALIGFRPCALYYGMQYMLFEISTPFANMHWFYNKSGMAGSRAQMYNGICLITSFALCRLVWGSYMSVMLYSDIWSALHPSITPVLTQIVYSPLKKPWHLEHSLPYWYAGLCIISNVGLMTLNSFWFVKMIQTLGKHLRNSKGKKEDGAVDPPKPVAMAQSGTTDARRRKA